MRALAAAASATGASGAQAEGGSRGSKEMLIASYLGPVELSTLLEIGEAALLDPCGSATVDDVVALLHSLVVEAVDEVVPSCSLERAAESPGRVVSLVCDYLDLLLVPLVLREAALREEAVRCPCERCFRAVQASNKLQHSRGLRTISDVASVHFLFHVLAQAATLILKANVRLDSAGALRALRAAESLAVLATHVRLREELRLHLPPEALRSLSVLLAVEAAAGGSQRCLLLGVLHVLRNVADNHEQVMVMTSEVFADCGDRLWAALMVPPSQEASAVSASPGGAEAPSAASASRLRRRRPGAVAEEEVSSHGASGSRLRRVAPSGPESQTVFDSGNPQESDEHASGAELAGTAFEKTGRGGGVDVLPAQMLDSADRTAAEREHEAAGGDGEVAGASDLGAQAAVNLELFSLAMQALFQSDGPLHQHAFASEEAIRVGLLGVADALKAAELPACRGRLAFQGLRLYLLVCRSSHARRQYAVMQTPFVERERRAVAFLQSLAPAAQRCCVLLRAMTQDIQGWLLWQTQAPSGDAAWRLAAAGDGAPRARLGGEPAEMAPAPRRRQRRLASSQSGQHPPQAAPQAAPKAPQAPEAPVAPATATRGARARPRAEAPDTQPTLPAPAPEAVPGVSASGVDAACAEDAIRRPSCFFSRGEAVWLAHALLLLLAVVFLVAFWRSLERPRRVWSH